MFLPLSHFTFLSVEFGLIFVATSANQSNIINSVPYYLFFVTFTNPTPIYHYIVINSTLTITNPKPSLVIPFSSLALFFVGPL